MKLYYSNCLFEALKYKLKNPKVKIIFLSPKMNDVKNIHFMWIDLDYVYDFHTDTELKWWTSFLYKGYLRKTSLHSFNTWRREMKQKCKNKGAM